MEGVVAAITVLAAGLVVHHHLLHPIVQKLVCRFKAKPDTPDFKWFESEAAETAYPHISVMMPAYNEAEHIIAKLETLAALIYPSHKMDITLVCDGCTDNTAALARGLLDERGRLGGFAFNLVEHQGNAGKLARLNQTIPALQGEIVVLTDVSAILSLDCLMRLAAWFSDAGVGAVVGQYHLLESGGKGQQAYWDYQVAIKQCEDHMGSVLGAHGAFYGFRKAAFAPLEPDTINDDFVLPMRIIQQGWQVRYDTGIAALEKEVVADTAEASRRKRIATGNVQQAIRLRALLHPRFGWNAYNFASGKGLRAFCPLFMLIALIGSALLAHNHWLFLVACFAQLFIYFLTTMDIVLHRSGAEASEYRFGALSYLVAGHLAGAAAVCGYLFRPRQSMRWR